VYTKGILDLTHKEKVPRKWGQKSWGGGTESSARTGEVQFPERVERDQSPQREIQRRSWGGGGGGGCRGLGIGVAPCFRRLFGAGLKGGKYEGTGSRGEVPREKDY